VRKVRGEVAGKLVEEVFDKEASSTTAPVSRKIFPEGIKVLHSLEGAIVE
jgi:hypothetical protein